MITNIAVSAIIVDNDSVLLLKRNNQPHNWCPPCGRLLINEHPIAGVMREVQEETSLNISVIMPVDVWFGKHQNESLISITYVCALIKGHVQLSDEHSDFEWIPIKDVAFRNINTDFDIRKWPPFIQTARYYKQLSPNIT